MYKLIVATFFFFKISLWIYTPAGFEIIRKFLCKVFNTFLGL